MSDTLTRVNAWLASRAGWLDASEQRQLLRAQWHAVTLAFGAESAAARGVLLGLVREAWGSGARIDLGWLASGTVRVEVMPRVGADFDESGTFAVALLAALEAAP